MPTWTPVLVLPNLGMRGSSVECEIAAIVGSTHARVAEVIAEHRNFGVFLSKFHGQFGEAVHPTVLMIKADAAPSYFTAEAVSAFRDLVALSVVPLARAWRLNSLRAQRLAYSNAFAFYPWMMGRDYEDLYCFTPAFMGVHFLSEFSGQSYPEQSQVSLAEDDIDVPVVTSLMSRWRKRYDGDGDWHDRALFRSLNMANEAAHMPGSTAVTFHEFGRSLALWVSAFEILTHPGGKRRASESTVFAAFDKVQWTDKALSDAKYWTRGAMRTLACHVYDRVYSLRNDFLHGNDVDESHLVVGKDERLMIDYAAVLYRLALTGVLQLTFTEVKPSWDEPEKLAQYISAHMDFKAPQEEHEDALKTFLRA